MTWVAECQDCGFRREYSEALESGATPKDRAERAAAGHRAAPGKSDRMDHTVELKQKGEKE